MKFNRLLIVTAATAIAAAQAPPPPGPAYKPTETEKQKIVAATTNLGKRISLIRERKHDPSLLNDVEVYYKAAQWMLRFPEEVYNKNYVAHANLVLERGIERAQQLEAGQSPWSGRKGQRVARAYRSRVDGSLQPYQVVVPESYDGARPIRLDVVLHGRGATLSEISFIAQAESAKPGVTYADRIELHVFGRTNNAYRWAGETDVFEALESVKSRYKIDDDRIILRGFSMGGAGTWHIGLHHPDQWVAIEAGAGFTETRRYAKQQDPAPWVEKTWRIYDAVDYARNAFNVPTVGYGGEIDPQLQASVNIKEQLSRESGLPDLRAIFLVGPQTPHKFHTDSKKESDVFMDKFAAAGLNRNPEKIRFVTYTARYNRCHWITVDGLERHYERAEVDADSGTIRTKNVARLTVARAGPLEIDGQKFGKPGTFEKRAGKWTVAPPKETALRKKRGLQGPIDDAFMDSFIVVKPTAAAASPFVTQRMERFLAEFAKWMRADPRTVDDTALTAEHIRDHNLILFGDPASNSVIRKIASKLPLKFSNHRTLTLIHPNPLNPSRYVVINSGHTFGEAEFKGTNALLFPRLGDWAELDSSGAVLKAGLFGEDWK